MHKLKKKSTILIISLIAALPLITLSGCKMNNNDLKYTNEMIEKYSRQENFSSPDNWPDASVSPERSSGKTNDSHREKSPVGTPNGITGNKDNDNNNGNKKKKVILDAPIIKQLPELKDGCEVTSLAMMLQYAGVKVDKMTLAREVKKDKDPLKKSNGQIDEWGDPEDGFVGDITGKTPGFGVYHRPIYELAEKYLPDRAVDLTGKSFDALIDSLSRGRPVVVWLTTDLDPPHSYKNWKDGDDGEKVKVTFQEHAVLLVGYDEKYCYINNPLSGIKNEKLTIKEFKKIWTDMGSMAVTYK